MFCSTTEEWERATALLQSNDPSLKQLELQWSTQHAQHFRNVLRILSHNEGLCPHLQRLSMCGSIDASHAVCEILAQILRQETNSLQSLRIELHIGDLGCGVLADALRQNSVLQKVVMRNCQIGDDGIRAIANAISRSGEMKLKSLGLTGNCFGIRGCAALMGSLCKSDNSIQEMNLSFCNLKKEGAKIIADALESNECHSLQIINLSHNQVGEDGCLLLAQALSHNTHLRTMDLSDNSIGSAGRMSLEVALRTNYKLVSLLYRDDRYGFSEDPTCKQDIIRHLQCNQRTPVRAEIIKTGMFPQRLLRTLHLHADSTMSNACYYVEALVKVMSFEGQKTLSVIFSLVREEPSILESKNLKRNDLSCPLTARRMKQMRTC